MTTQKFMYQCMTPFSGAEPDIERQLATEVASPSPILRART
jgi:hypothetical protein